MKNVFKIISKNLKVLLRSKSSALIIIFAPLLVILLVGVAFDNSNAFGITIGVHAPTSTENTQEFVQALSANEFKVLEYDSEQVCIEDIKRGLVNTCVVFPADFSFDTNDPKEVNFYVDHSKINLVYMVMDTLEGKFSSESNRVSKDLTNQLLDQLRNAREQLLVQQGAITELQNAQENAKSTVQTVQGNLQKLNVFYPSNTLPIDASLTTLDIAKTSLSGALTSAKKNNSAAREAAEASGASEEDKSDIKKYINRGTTSITNAEKSVDDGNESLTALRSLISGMQTELGSLETRLDTASSAIIDGQQKLGATALSLSSSGEKLTSTQGAITGIISSFDSLSVTDAGTIAAPVRTKINPVAAQSTYLNYLFPSLMILVIMFIAILLGTTLVMMDKHSPAYFRNSITPTHNITFVVSTYLTTLLLVVIQLAIIVGIASIFFSAQILPVLPVASLILVVAATFFALVGMAVGYAFTSEETGTLAAISVGSIFLFMSNVIIPLESMPTAIREIASYNPFVIAERALRSSILFKPSIDALSMDFFYLLGGSLVLFLGILGGHHMLSKHPLERTVSFHKVKIHKPKPTKNKKHQEVSKNHNQKQSLKKSQHPTPHKYLEQMINKGFSQQKILEAFKKAGYSPRHIRDVVAQYKKKRKHK